MDDEKEQMRRALARIMVQAERTLAEFGTFWEALKALRAEMDALFDGKTPHIILNKPTINIHGIQDASDFLAELEAMRPKYVSSSKGETER